MSVPAGIAAIDLWMAIPADGPAAADEPGADDLTKRVIGEMDRQGIERAMIGVDFEHDAAQRALKDHPDRFFASGEVDPNRGMEEVHRLVALYERFGLKAATASPAGLSPQVPIDDRKFYPLYAKCIELDIPICVCTGVPDARVPMAPQHLERVDEVCWFFPELRFVMRHGGEPWTHLAVKLMLKWPNLHYSTSALAPGDYPKDIVDYANTRGADRILYGGRQPLGLRLEQGELASVPFRAHVWPKFLRENALRVFKLGN